MEEISSNVVDVLYKYFEKQPQQPNKQEKKLAFLLGLDINDEEFRTIYDKFTKIALEYSIHHSPHDLLWTVCINETLQHYFLKDRLDMSNIDSSLISVEIACLSSFFIYIILRMIASELRDPTDAQKIIMLSLMAENKGKLARKNIINNLYNYSWIKNYKMLLAAIMPMAALSDECRSFVALLDVLSSYPFFLFISAILYSFVIRDIFFKKIKEYDSTPSSYVVNPVVNGLSCLVLYTVFESSTMCQDFPVLNNSKM